MTDEQKTLKEILFGMYHDNIATCRHHETQRATVTSFIIAIDTIIIGLVTFDKSINGSDTPLCLLLAILGVFGAIFTYKHNERYYQHVERARQYRKELDEQFAGGEILRLKEIADAIHARQFPRLRKFRHHHFWIILHLVMLAIGLVLLALALFSPQNFGNLELFHK